MKLVTFRPRNDPGAPAKVGVVDGESLRCLKAGSSMRAIVEAWGAERPRLEVEEGPSVPLAEVQLLPPLMPTGNIFCVGKNYLEHVKEVDSGLPGITQLAAPEYPIIFTKAPGCVIGHQDTIKYPHGVSDQVDYEGELAVIIGKGGSCISREDAAKHIFGYTVLNDVTARDVQKRHQQWFLGKSMDTFCPMGPWIVPAADIDITKALRVQTWVNDDLRQDGSTLDMIFPIAELIEVISKAMTLHPGDVLATGTPAGVGAGFKPPRWLKPGDKVRVAIEGIGELENTVGTMPSSEL
eukprot:CAMPEP_0198201828 /NCGR_PEP_ID=MMETSP1445-20131203/4859_1 /TAXON_ID=36898 /ORGANISM="Pyramimonas sp., Strain CCMP2087" /LENGTH=294 /DNA_ID=CAMNT_0043872463 /DNA_START=184 /DNA_END=1068 /DNA_ORIENTATION=-